MLTDRQCANVLHIMEIDPKSEYSEVGIITDYENKQYIFTVSNPKHARIEYGVIQVSEDEKSAFCSKINHVDDTKEDEFLMHAYKLFEYEISKRLKANSRRKVAKPKQHRVILTSLFDGV